MLGALALSIILYGYFVMTGEGAVLPFVLIGRAGCAGDRAATDGIFRIYTDGTVNAKPVNPQVAILGLSGIWIGYIQIIGKAEAQHVDAGAPRHLGRRAADIGERVGEARGAIVGAEALRTAAGRAAKAAKGEDKSYNAIRKVATRREPDYAQKHGLAAPVDVYPLYENGTRAAWGQSLADAQAEAASKNEQLRRENERLNQRKAAIIGQLSSLSALATNSVAEFPGDDDHQASASQSDESSEQGDAVTEQADDDDATRVQPAASGGSKRR